ncbi:MAG: hypothetical protein LBB90_00040, partial [Tannerella sp.]|nr:hypothetical protein [Tannerella sp.]
YTTHTRFPVIYIFPSSIRNRTGFPCFSQNDAVCSLILVRLPWFSTDISSRRDEMSVAPDEILGREGRKKSRHCQ